MSTPPQHGPALGPAGGVLCKLTAPSSLAFRDLAMRGVAAVCKLFQGGGKEFHEAILSAFSEALNNVVFHSYGSHVGKIELEPRTDGLTIRLTDHGRPFDPEAIPDPDLDCLPETVSACSSCGASWTSSPTEAGRPTSSR